jgi:hypothetical protein
MLEVGTRKLVFASFFFWKPGSALQKSLEGLFQALLHDVLKENPTLIPHALPDQWEQARSMPWQIQTEMQVRVSDIRKAFTELITNSNVFKTHCFCFFIDGLDEYEETDQHDFKSFVNILNTWVTHAPRDIKLCVSSREYNVFINGFSDRQRFKLQDLTWNDMKHYIEESLEITDPGTETEQLVHDILLKANGVFLWVNLVVKSLREQLESGDKLPALHKSLESLPSKLEELYGHLLDSINEVFRKKAYRIFAMAKTLSDNSAQFGTGHTFDFNLPLHSLSYLDDFERDPEFAMRESFPASIMAKSCQSRLELARKQLIGSCRGLLEVQNLTYHPGDVDVPSISWIHRSISEFLESVRFRDAMAAYAKSFCPEEAISQLVLAEIQSMPLETESLAVLNHRVYSLLLLRSRSRLDCEPYRYLNFLNSVVMRYDPLDSEVICRSLIYCARYVRVPGCFTCCNRVNTAGLATSVLEISAYLGLYHYVQRQIEHDLSLVEMYGRAVVLWVCYEDICRGPLDSEGHKILEGLFKRGVSPQNSIHANHRLSIANTAEARANLTLWEQSLLNILASPQTEEGRWPTKAQGDMIQLFLEYGADPLLEISTSGSGSGVYRVIISGIEIDWFSWERRVWDICQKNGGRLSFLDLVQSWDLDNKDTILGLISQFQSRRLKECAAPAKQPHFAEEPDRPNLVEYGESTPSSPTSSDSVGQMTSPQSMSPVLTGLKKPFVGYQNVGIFSLCTFVFFDR